MRAILCEGYGPADDLVVADVPSPDLRPGTVELTVLAAGVDDVDNLIIGGRYQVATPTPFVPGFEFVGRITDVADDVARDAPHLEPGRRVLVASGTGGYAEEVVVPAHLAVPVPDGVRDGQAATCAQSYPTAVVALEHRAQAERGQTMPVIGAGGGVGLAAIDVGASLGLWVFAEADLAERRAAGKLVIVP